ncbi:zf-DNL-domain-containing protein [Laetiporus sulphureus 93-53]|uniref:Zf-DNL-domain-containing protein n=1 Tax=Laetiporus sulphureus 93-53 TaxID=1314785 RepID=A0A165G4I4_9APHY|nr:zf-DNL-domain-containing protein [Laetiporus sulphureus 93-53]KZT09819.1 zf-DNL-domain-containing protein [Laetiporus sulphureus 93-53]
MASSAVPLARISHPWTFGRQPAALLPRSLSSSAANATQASSSRPSSSSPERLEQGPEAQSSSQDAAAFAIEPRLSLTFTCTVTTCGTRSSHQFTRRSYEKGIVIVQCPGCKNRHLIADHLGWFKESTEDGKMKTVEDLVRAKGEKVRRGVLLEDGVVEYAPE